MCEEAPGLAIEKRRLLDTVGGSFLGIIGDIHHSFGYHLCAPPGGDYSTQGWANSPVGPYSCAIDIGMDWSASRAWLRWLIGEIGADRVTGIAEVIGSYDGANVRYWSDDSGWSTGGVPYDGQGHDTWTHVGVYRSTAMVDHGILAGWTASGYQGGDMGIENVEQMITELYPYIRGTTSGRVPGGPKAGQRITDTLDGAELPGTRQLAEQAAKNQAAVLAAVAKPVTVTLTDAQLVQLADLLAAKLGRPLTAAETEDAAYRAAQHAEDS